MQSVKVNVGVATRDELPCIVSAAEAFAAAIGRNLDLEYAVYCGPMVSDLRLNSEQIRRLVNND